MKLRRQMLRLDAKLLAMWLGGGVVVCALAQLAMGASVGVVGLCALASIVALGTFATLGAYNAGAWAALFYAVGNTIIALFAKTIFGQSLDSNLNVPFEAFASVTLCGLALCSALLLVRLAPVGKPLLPPIVDPRVLARFSWLCAVLAFLAWYTNSVTDVEEGTRFGGAAIFRDLFLMAVIARTAMLLEASGFKKSFDWKLGAILLLSMFTGSIDNTKTGTALPVLSYFLTVVVYRRGLPVRVAMALAAGGLAFSAILAPAVQGMRALGQQGLTTAERVEFVLSNIAALITSPDQISAYEKLGESTLLGAHYNYFGGEGAGQLLLGRYAAVQQVDPVIERASRQGLMGGAAVLPAFGRVLPSFLNPGKTEYGEEYYILAAYSLTDPMGGRYPTLPLAGQAYAADGMFGVAWISLLTFLGFFIVLKKIGWSLHRNIFGVFVVAQFILVFVSQGSFGQFVAETLRYLPSFVVVFLLLRFAAARRFSLGRQTTSPVARSAR